MAVDFSLLPPECTVPDRAPSPFVWSIVFVVLALAGVAYALWSWPHGAKTQTPQFWFCVGILPVCGVGILVLSRFAFFYKRRNIALSDIAIRNAYVRILFDVASVPLAVLSAAYRVHANDDENAFDAIVERSKTPATRLAVNAGEMVVASCFEPAAAALCFDDTERQKEVLKWILCSFAPMIERALNATPVSIPVAVNLDIDSRELGNEEIGAIWSELTATVCPGRLSNPPVIRSSGGVWLVDRMLDQTGPSRRDVLTLLISANLNAVHAADPSPGSAEAACMMLLCPASLARDADLAVQGWIHRPQDEAAAPLGQALDYALTWGRTIAEAVGGTIQTGGADVAARLRKTLNSGSNAGHRSAGSDFSLEALVGDTGTTAPWLAAALALDRATLSSMPYLIGNQSGDQLLIAVVAPAEQHTKQEQ